MNKTTEITRRLSDEPCKCGCKGGDPWHAQKFDRVITNVREESGKRVVHAYSFLAEYARIGTARLPWGEGRPVVVVELEMTVDAPGGPKKVSLGWFSTGEIVEVAS
jgi:hypothetical protein